MAKRKTRTAPKKKANKARAKKTSLVQCVRCPALCCHDLAIPTTKPRSADEIDYLRWHVQYDTVHLVIRSHRWYILVKGRCIYLDDDNMCTIYNRRPSTCREHKPAECERFGKWYDHWISTPEELDVFLAKAKKRRKR